MSGIDPKDGLLIALAAFALFYLVVVVRGVMSQRATTTEGVAPSPGRLLTGFVTNFFDTIGIGSYATTTAIFRKWKLVPDERIPGTLNVGHTIPTIAQAYIFTKIVPVDAMTLILMIGAAVVGAWLGAGVVASWPRRKIQIGMGLALTAAAILMALSVMKLVPGGGDLLRLEGGRLAIGLAGNVVLGALMTIGIGLYAPCMILIYLLGMQPTAAFPIMMGSCAFLMPVASARFVRAKSFDIRATLGLMIGGLPAVFPAAALITWLNRFTWRGHAPADAVRVLVVFVVLYTAYGMLATARRERAMGGAVAGTARAEGVTP
jgi:uncharacterized membrane protein YfcA